MKESIFTNATVIKHTGGQYQLCLLPQWEPFTAVLRGKIRLQGDRLTNPIAVGDKVDGLFQEGASGPQALITAIHPRRNYLIRKSTNLSRQTHIIAANIDAAYLIVSATEPETPLAFIDRLFVTCQAYRVPVTLVINKMDELDRFPDYRSQVAHLRRIYTTAGYPILEVSACNGQGLATFQQALAGKTSLLAGISGVGKSSLANALDPSLQLKTGAISSAHLTGKHTTTFYQMHALSAGGYIIDSPGIKGFGLLEMDKYEIYHFFPEIFAASSGCKFNPCLHVSEPHCAVKQAVEAGTIAPERYQNYLKILEDPDGEKYRC